MLLPCPHNVGGAKSEMHAGHAHASAHLESCADYTPLLSRSHEQQQRSPWRSRIPRQARRRASCACVEFKWQDSPSRQAPKLKRVVGSPLPPLLYTCARGRDRPICKFGKTAAFTPRCTYLAGFSSGAKKHQETRGGGSEPPLLLPPAGRAASSVRALAQVARRVATRSPGHLCARALLRTAAAVARPAALTDWRNGGNEGVRSADSHPSVLVARQSSDWRGMSPVVARHRTGEHRSL